MFLSYKVKKLMYVNSLQIKFGGTGLLVRNINKSNKKPKLK